MLGVNTDQYVDVLPYVVVTTKSGPLCEALMSKADVKAHTADYVTGNQCSLIGTETWQLNKLGIEEVHSYSSPSNQNFIPYKGLNSSTLQTISDYKLLSTSAQGTSCARLCKGNRNLCTAQVLPQTTEVSLKPTSRGIVNSFRNSKGAVHTPGQAEGPKQLLLTDDAIAHFPEVLVLNITIT